MLNNLFFTTVGVLFVLSAQSGAVQKGICFYFIDKCVDGSGIKVRSNMILSDWVVETYPLTFIDKEIIYEGF